jgi:hypothetical protein
VVAISHISLLVFHDAWHVPALHTESGELPAIPCSANNFHNYFEPYLEQTAGSILATKHYLLFAQTIPVTVYELFLNRINSQWARQS